MQWCENHHLWVVITTKFYFIFILISLLCVILSAAGQPRVAVIREEGSNGDREMSVSLYMAGFEVTIQSFINWIYVDLSCMAGVHDSSSSICVCVGVGCHHAGPVLWLPNSGVFQSGRVCWWVQLRRRPGIRQRQINTHTYAHTFIDCFDIRMLFV